MSARRLFGLSPVCGLVLALSVGAPAMGADFAGQNVGAIPDNTPGGRNVSFDVSGLAAELRAVELSVTLTHTFVGDLQVRLTSPAGLSSLVIFSRVGLRRTGSDGQNADLGATYVFRDSAPTDFWAQAAANPAATIPAGVFRTTTAGRPGLSNIGGCSTHLNQAFGGLTPAQANGQWTLSLIDKAAGDTGTVSAASLKLLTSADLLPASTVFRGGFEDAEPGAIPSPSSTTGTCRDILFDYTGSGLTSYVTIRNSGGGPGGAITWTIRENDGSTTGTLQEFVFGIASDNFGDGDYDGDGIRDAAIYTPSTHTLTVRRSSRPLDAPLVITLGQTGDDPTVSGDYDGDNITDFALYRAGASAGLPSKTIVRSTRTGAVREFISGENGFFPYGGLDLTGDRVADMAVQSNAGDVDADGMADARFTVFSGTNGANVGTFIFGKPTDVIIPGNFVGTGLNDVTVVRGAGGVIEWRTRNSADGVVTGPVMFGVSASDFVLAGDYDGDGYFDQAVWRPSVTANQSKFIVRKSTDPGGVPLEVFQGQQGHLPVATSRNH